MLHLCGVVCTERQILSFDVHACNFISSTVIAVTGRSKRVTKYLPKSAFEFWRCPDIAFLAWLSWGFWKITDIRDKCSYKLVSKLKGLYGYGPPLEWSDAIPVLLCICCDRRYKWCFEGQNFRRVSTRAVSVTWLQGTSSASAPITGWWDLCHCHFSF